MNIIERAQAPTPKFFKILRTVGVVMLAISGSVMAAPIALPAIVVTVAGYLAVAGGVVTAVSQVTVDDKLLGKNQQEGHENETYCIINGRYRLRNSPEYRSKCHFRRYSQNSYFSYCRCSGQFSDQRRFKNTVQTKTEVRILIGNLFRIMLKACHA